MRRFSLAGPAAALLAISLAPSLARAEAPIVARAEDCLRDRVDGVVAVEPDLAAAANFLTTYACAEAVAGAARYFGNLQAVAFVNAMPDLPARPPTTPDPKGKGPALPATMKSLAEDASARASVDPETGEIRFPEKDSNPFGGLFRTMLQNLATSRSGSPAVPVELRQFAGELVLKAKARRTASAAP